MKKEFGKGHCLYLIDGSGYIFRAYHALPPLTRRDGLPIGAVSGFCNMISKLLAEENNTGQATHIAVIFDHKGKTFRSSIYQQYKANRPPPPDDLIPQFGLIRKATIAFGLTSIEMKGYEADDIIASYAKYAQSKGGTTKIISSDKDLMQLIGDGISIYDPVKNKVLGLEDVQNKFGVSPSKVVDVQALAGDSVDNIPGAPGIGIKTASKKI